VDVGERPPVRENPRHAGDAVDAHGGHRVQQRRRPDELQRPVDAVREEVDVFQGMDIYSPGVSGRFAAAD